MIKYLVMGGVIHGMAREPAEPFSGAGAGDRAPYAGR